MELNNDKQRTPKIREGSKGSKFEGESTSVETLSNSCRNTGVNTFPVSGENSQQRNTAIRRKQSSIGITGEVINQLVQETEKQLAYHSDQVKVLERRLKELSQISDSIKDKKSND